MFIWLSTLRPRRWALAPDADCDDGGDDESDCLRVTLGKARRLRYWT